MSNKPPRQVRLYVLARLKHASVGIEWTVFGFSGGLTIHPFWWVRWLKLEEKIGGLGFDFALGPVSMYQMLGTKMIGEYLFSFGFHVHPNPIYMAQIIKRIKEENCND